MTKTAALDLDETAPIPETEALGQQEKHDYIVPGSREYRQYVSQLLRGTISYDEFMDKLEPEGSPQRDRLMSFIRTLVEGLAGRSFPGKNPPR